VRPLVEAGALDEIRDRIRSIHRTAEAEEIPLDDRLHVLLFFARSARNHEPSRSEAIASLKTAISDDPKFGPRLSLLTRRLLAYALCELDENTFMCDYLKRTQGPEAEQGQHEARTVGFMRKIAGDNGDGVETLELLLRLIKFHAEQQRAPLVALNLRTAAQLIDRTIPSATHPWPTALTNLRATLDLREQVRSLRGSQTTWLSKHKCDICQGIISRYTEHLLKRIDDFGKAFSNCF
jgi:hypothetical protein